MPNTAPLFQGKYSVLVPNSTTTARRMPAEADDPEPGQAFDGQDALAA